MLGLRLTTLDPAYNLALEEHLLLALPPGHPGLFLLWRNRPSVIVGRHQCAADEVNADFIARENIPVIRRITGGGAVYHDLGNLNFSFLVHAKNAEERAGADFGRFLPPVIAALADVGVQARPSGRNDLEVGGRKIAGCARLARGLRVLCHGALLVRVDFDRLAAALRVDPDKIRAKGVPSVRARVGNIAEYWRPGCTLDALADALMSRCAEGVALLTPEDHAAAEALAAAKYRQPDWNDGPSSASGPETLEHKRRFPWGTVRLRLEVRDGLIRSCAVSGDFFSNRDIADLEARLIGRSSAT